MREFAEGEDILLSTDIAQTMGLHPHEIAIDLDKSTKFKDIVEFFGPYENREHMLSKLTRRVNKEDAIQHVWKYVSLRKQMDTKAKELEEITSVLKTYER